MTHDSLSASRSQPLSALDRVTRQRLLPHTPVTLLQRVRQNNDRTAWDDLVRLLVPLVDHWVQQTIRDRDDRADVGQDVFLELSKRLPTWNYDSSRSFRAWLRTVTRTKCVDLFRKRGNAAGEQHLSKIASAEVPDELERQEALLLTRAALSLLESQVRPDIWAIFRQYVLEEIPAATVSRTCGVEVGYVYLVRNRLLTRLRGLLENLQG
ncbi:RNA polymerase sigma factor [Limnoglobus roseus]|uniref:Sigma-70 family RNA polymerase sigma factor n=1 Tax=Limnoglobus roseus TaxID=2598579 RepID=A0A5C1A7Z3_9BACT|nr:sigma-70 family RNA polymerase sigma factor [Limnoglobus roseus]QEL13244.1 sigma-70 family RNA polymerase sigma factor [Limnoglobus roseus]